MSIELQRTATHYCPSCMLLYSQLAYCAYCKVLTTERRSAVFVARKKPKKKKAVSHEIPRRFLYGRPDRRMIPFSELESALDRLYSSMGV